LNFVLRRSLVHQPSCTCMRHMEKDSLFFFLHIIILTTYIVAKKKLNCHCKNKLGFRTSCSTHTKIFLFYSKFVFHYEFQTYFKFNYSCIISMSHLHINNFHYRIINTWTVWNYIGLWWISSTRWHSYLHWWEDCTSKYQFT